MCELVGNPCSNSTTGASAGLAFPIEDPLAVDRRRTVIRGKHLTLRRFNDRCQESLTTKLKFGVVDGIYPAFYPARPRAVRSDLEVRIGVRCRTGDSGFHRLQDLFPRDVQPWAMARPGSRLPIPLRRQHRRATSTAAGTPPWHPFAWPDGFSAAVRWDEIRWRLVRQEHSARSRGTVSQECPAGGAGGPGLGSVE